MISCARETPRGLPRLNFVVKLVTISIIGMQCSSVSVFHVLFHQLSILHPVAQPTLSLAALETHGKLTSLQQSLQLLHFFQRLSTSNGLLYKSHCVHTYTFSIASSTRLTLILAISAGDGPEGV